jgi:phosphatidate cytidylyltransferase
MSPAAGGSWSDLRPRVISAAVMIVVGGAATLWGGIVLVLLVALVTGVMIWELARLSAPMAMFDALGLGLGAALCLLLEAAFGSVTFVFLCLPALALALTPRKDARLAGFAALALMISAHTVLGLRHDGGFVGILWLIGIVIAADTAGYFVGRRFGGPKFWPAVSPNKTWSGTVAGWGAALAVGLVFWLWGPGGWELILLSPLIALAGQIGDIAESWIKRRAGVKDSSALIPGHGGFLDRFDALTGAAVALFLLSPLLGWPVGG